MNRKGNDMQIKFTGNSQVRPLHKMIITGTGRAGTTFLVQLLTALDVETGFRDIYENVYENCHAGMEKDIHDPSAPYLIKDPSLCDELAQIVESGICVIDHVFIPVRDLEAAAMSRISVSQQARKFQTKKFQKGHLRFLFTGARDKRAVPGGLIGTDNPEEQSHILTEKLYRLIYAISVFDIPHTFLHFPRIIQDPRYLHQKLAPIIGDMDYSRFKQAFDDVVRPELVHDFSLPCLMRPQYAGS